jgi:hypothetical protein
LISKRLLTKNSSWQAKQSVPRTIVMFYGDCMKMCEDFTPNFRDKRTGCCITTMHRLTFSLPPGNFLPRRTWLSSPTHSACLTWSPATFLFFSDWR